MKHYYVVTHYRGKARKTSSPFKTRKAAVHIVAQDVLRCWEAALQKARGLAIDANGNQVTIAGVPVPCAGNWRQP